MSDDFETLRAALKSAPPAPEPGAKVEAMRLAMENFDRHQETAKAPRPMSDRPQRAGILTGVARMFSKLTTRGALTATASVAAISLGVMLWPNLQRSALVPEPVAPVLVEEAALTETAQRQRTEATTPSDAAKAPNAEPAIAPAAPVAKAAPKPEGGAEIALGGHAQTAMTSVAQSDAATTFYNEREAATFVGDLADDSFPSANTEAFASEAQNPLKIAAEEPVSTFSIDVDTASYAVIRSSLAGGQLPPSDAVRIEEMVNYFPYSYAAPDAGAAPFHTSVSLFQTPWNADTQLLRIGIQGALPAIEGRPPLNLVFLIDTSGSMDAPDKLPLLKQSFRLMLNQLRPEDQVAIVTYAGSAGLVLAPTAAKDKAAILGALERLDAGGATAGAAGLELAYQTAEQMAGDNRISRILLATDGDFNVGVSDPEGLEAYVAKKRDSGSYLSVLGFGRGNLDDATMQTLAQNGNGQASYIDTLSEAQKVLVDQLSGALFPIANDVKIQVEFNPAAVAEYRLIGYETRALAREDFNNDRIDAGEIGAGHQVTALYEVTPVGSPARLSDPLRYVAADLPSDASELGFLKLRYKAPGSDTSTLTDVAIPVPPAEADLDARFAAAIAGMGQLLRDPKYLGEWGWDDAIALANDAKGNDPFGYRAEAVQLMRLAQSLSR
jgi:Ca-activated chloride channel homolog